MRIVKKALSAFVQKGTIVIVFLAMHLKSAIFVFIVPRLGVVNDLDSVLRVHIQRLVPRD